MKKRVKSVAFALVTMCMLSSAYAQVVISSVGSGTGYDAMGEEVYAFRSSGVTKTFDADDDNAYGTTGYLFFGDGTPGRIVSQPFSFHTMATLSFVTGFAPGADFNSVASIDEYTKIDDPTLPIVADVAEWGNSGLMVAATTDANRLAGAWLEMMTFTIDATAPASIRLGILSAVDPFVDGRWDPTGLRLSFEGGAPIAVTNLEETTEGMVFFDIEIADGMAGTFLIEGQKRLDGFGPSLAGITFDGGGTYVPPTPPPTTITTPGDGTGERGYDEYGVAAASFRSTDVAKAYNTGSLEAYGTAGYWSVGDGSTATVVDGSPAWASNFVKVLTLTANNALYADFDDPTAGIGEGVVDWTTTSMINQGFGNAGAWHRMLTFDIGGTVPRCGFRLGILAGNEGTPDGRWDAAGFRLSFEGGTATAIEGLGVTPDGIVGMVFFDVITDGKVGTLTIEGQTRSVAPAKFIKGPSLSVLTFDVLSPIGTVFLVQ